MRTDLFFKQTSLNLVIFDKNEGNSREKKIFQKMLNPSLLMEVCEEPELLHFVKRKTPFCKVPGKEPLEIP